MVLSMTIKAAHICKSARAKSHREFASSSTGNQKKMILPIILALAFLQQGKERDYHASFVIIVIFAGAFAQQ